MKNQHFLFLFQFFSLLAYTTATLSYASSSINILEINNIDQLRQINVQVPSELQKERHSIFLVLSEGSSFLAKPASELQKSDIICAHAEFKDTISSVGWNEVSVQTNGTCGGLGSMFAAGWAEGFLTAELISLYYNKYISNKANANGDYPEVKNTFEQVYFHTLTKTRDPKIVHSEAETVFWKGIELFASQLEGLIAGANARKGQTPITLGDLLFANSNGEISDLVDVLQNYIKSDEPKIFLQQSTRLSKKDLRASKYKKYSMKDILQKGLSQEEADEMWLEKLMKSHCSAFIKLIRDEKGLVKDVMAAHGTWDSYEGMMKMMKKYNFKVPLQAGESPQDYKIIFPSYPGCITSQDDFYVKANGFILTETTLNIFDDDLYQANIDSSTYMPTFLKLAAANFLGQTAEDWIKYFSLINTGTYNSQWMLIDTESLKNSISQKQLAPGTFFVLEQIPGTIVHKDMSMHLNKNSYWASFNLPMFDETYDKSGCKAMYDQAGSASYSRSDNPRAVIFKEMAGQITTVEDLKNLIRLNKIDQNNSISVMQNSQGSQIAPRFDLHPDENKRKLFGETDAKIATVNLAKETSLLAISGPTKMNSGAFSFSDDAYKNLKGIPQTWDFDWQQYSV